MKRCTIALTWFLLPSFCFSQELGTTEVYGAPARVLEAQGAQTSLPPAPGPSLTLDQQAPQTQAQASALPLTLDEAIAMAERSSPRMRAAAANVERFTAAARTARAYANPTLEVYQGQQYARPVPSPGAPGWLQHYAGSQAIEIPSERRARKAAASSAIASSRFAQQGVALSVIGNVKRAFYQALRRREQIRHARENLDLVRDLNRRVEVEVRTGEKGRLELTRTQAELARATFAVRSAELEYANAIAFLRVTIAAPADANLEPQGEFESRITLPSALETREAVLRSHPAIAQSQADIATAGANLNREQALRIPQPTAFAEFENQPDLRFWRAGVSIPIPLWDRRKGQIAEAQATIAQSRAALDEQRLELLSSLERAYEQYQLADQQATSLESGSMRAAESAVDAAKAAYRFGERGIVEVLDAQRVLQSVRADLLDARFARQSALIDLQELGMTPAATRP